MLQFKEFLSVLPLIAILGFVLFYALSSNKLFHHIIEKIEYCFHLVIAFISILISCFVFLAIFYIFINNKFSQAMLSDGILHQIFVLLFAMTLLLLIEIGVDFLIINHFLKNKQLNNSDMKILSVFLKITITVVFTFIFGVKDSAYSVAQANGIQAETLFVYDMCLMFLTSSIAGFDFVLDTKLESKQ